MKIGISCHHTYGGSGAIAAELGKALASRGHIVHFFSQAAPFRLGAFSGNIFCHEVEVMHYPLFDCPFYSLALASKIAEVAWYEQLDVVHAHYAIPHALSAMLARQMLEDKCSERGCFRIATTLHGTDITVVGADRGMQDVVRLAINKSDGVTAVSGYLRDETNRMFSPKKDISVIPNFVDTSIFSRKPDPALRSNLGLGGGKIIIHISNFRPVKCISDIVQVFHALTTQTDVIMLFVGDGPERGVPVVATDAGGFPEFIQSGLHGYLLPPGDIAAMTGRALMLLTDETLHKRFADASAEQARRFETAQLVERYEAFYKGLLER